MYTYDDAFYFESITCSRRDPISVKTADLQNTLANIIGVTQDLARDFDLPPELSVPTKYWKALRHTADFSNILSGMLEELTAQDLLKPIARSDIKIALNHFQFDPYVRDLILDFTEPMSFAMIAEELYRQRKYWKAHDEVFSYDGMIMEGPNHQYNRFRSINEFWSWLEASGYLLQSIGGVLLKEDYDWLSRSHGTFSKSIDRFRIGFLEVTGIFHKRKDSGCRDITYQKIPVMYDVYKEYSYIYGNLTMIHAFRPSQWNEYISKLNLKKHRHKQQEVRLKFTSGPTLREAIHLNVSNDVKHMISDMVKQLVSFLQAGCRSWAGCLIEELLLNLYEKEVRFINGWLYEKKDTSRKGDCVDLDQQWGKASLTSDLGKVALDPIKTSRQIKWKRTKENSQRKRRQKYDKDRKFRRKRVHNKVWATKV